MFSLANVVGQVNRQVGTSSTLVSNANTVVIAANVANSLTATLLSGLLSLVLPIGVYARVYDDNGVLVAIDASVATTVAAGVYHVVIYSDIAGTFTVAASLPIAATPTPTPTPTPATAQQITDKLAITSLKNRIKAGESVADDEMVFFFIGDSVVATAVVAALDSGGGYDELRLIGLSEAMTINVIGIYNVKIDPLKYESELGLSAIAANPLLLGSFFTYLKTNLVDFPSLVQLFTAIRSKPATYAALREWNKTRAV